MGFSGVIHSIRKLTPTAYLVRMHRDSEFDFEAGQHLQLAVGGAGVGAPGFFSIASPPEAEWLELIVRAPGRTSGQPEVAADALVGLAPGQCVALEGPFGKFRYQSQPTRHACFVA